MTPGLLTLIWNLAFSVSVSVTVVGCAGVPAGIEGPDLETRVESLQDGKVVVEAVVLSPAESRAAFSLPLARRGIQPVWVEVDNQEDYELYPMFPSVDPDYYSPSEVVWKFRGSASGNIDDDIERMVESHLPAIVPPRSRVSGYVFTTLDPGAKAFSVELLGEQDFRSFHFTQLVPGFEADFMRVDTPHLYPADEVRDLTLDELRQYLEELPCCVLGGDRKTPGDPLNLIVVGDGKDVLSALVRIGWDLTETLRGDTAWRTVVSSVFSSKYRTSPVSPLYLYDRPQDIALQKIRRNVDERNHLRLWLAPVRHEGSQVWIGQISRDIGVKLSSKTLITHKIDPVVDEARLYIALDLAGSQSLRGIGHVSGVGDSDRDNPRFNYTRDPYYTDGHRVVLFVGDDRYPLESIDFLPWEEPAAATRHYGDRDRGPGAGIQAN